MVDSQDVTGALWYLRWLLSGLLLLLGLLVDIDAAQALVITASGLLIGVNIAHRYLRHLIDAPLVVFGLLIVDLSALCLGLAVSGGVSNPLIGLMMLPLAVAAIALPWRLAATMAAAAVGSYGVLTVWHFPLPFPDHAVATLFHWHLWGMWGNFALTSVLMVIGISWLSAQLVKQHERVSRIRDKLTRREAVIAVATEAAVTSHEMSTPLSTALMMTDELSERNDLPVQAAEDVQLLGEQLRRCRNALQRIRDVGDESRGRMARNIDLAAFIADVELRFATLKPGARLRCTFDTAAQRQQSIRVEIPAFSAAVLNLLENAVESPDGDRFVTLTVDVDAAWATFDVCGTGVRVPTTVSEQPFPASSKAHGLGVGVLLSHATIEQAGGQLIWLGEGSSAGQCVRICVPVSQDERRGHQ